MSIPSIYLHSKLFHRPVRDDRDNSDRDRKVKIRTTKSVPDAHFEDLEPGASEALEVAKNKTAQATSLLRSITEKANPGSTALVPTTEGQRAGSFGTSSASGVRGVETPDLPGRGSKWDEKPEQGNQNVDKPPMNLVDDEPDADKAIKRIMGSAHEEAKKAFVAAPRFSPGPFVPPREKEFLLLNGYTDEDIARGFIMPPRLRAAFNKWLTATVQKSISGLLS